MAFKCVYPSIGDLSREDAEPTCPVTGCGKTFRHRGMLRMHVVKTHKILSDENDVKYTRHKSVASTKSEVDARFFCPISTCAYHAASKNGKFFKTYDLLLSHFRRVHEEKRHACPLCPAKFARECDLTRHAKSCGVRCACAYCGQNFDNLDAMRVHQLRQHAPSSVTLKSKDKLIHTIVQNTMEFVTIIENAKFADGGRESKKDLPFILPKPTPSTSERRERVKEPSMKHSPVDPEFRSVGKLMSTCAPVAEATFTLPAPLDSLANKSSAETQTSKDLTIEGSLRVDIPTPSFVDVPEKHSRGAQVSPRAKRFCRAEAASSKETKHNETQTKTTTLSAKRALQVTPSSWAGDRRMKASSSRGTHADMRMSSSGSLSFPDPSATSTFQECSSLDLSACLALGEFNAIFESISTQTKESFLSNQKRIESTDCSINPPLFQIAAGSTSQPRDVLVGRDLSFSPVGDGVVGLEAPSVPVPLDPLVTSPFDVRKNDDKHIETQTDISLAVLEGLWSLSSFYPPTSGTRNVAPFMTHIETQTLDSEPVGFGDACNYFAHTETQTTEDLFPDLVDCLTDIESLDDVVESRGAVVPRLTADNSKMTPRSSLETFNVLQQQHQSVQTNAPMSTMESECRMGKKEETDGFMIPFSLTDSQTQTNFPSL